MAAQEITKTARTLAKVAGMTSQDLASREAVETIVSAAYEATADAKQAKDADQRVRAEIRRICAEHIEAGDKVTMYNIGEESKVTLSPKAAAVEFDEGALLEALWEAYGEEPGNTKGKAWKAWLACTRPAREFDKAKFDAALEKGDEAFKKAAMSCVSYGEPSYTLRVSDMTKAEIKAAGEGELTQFVVVG